MGSVDVLREITPLSPEDCFLVMQRPKRSFSYPRFMCIRNLN